MHALAGSLSACKGACLLLSVASTAMLPDASVLQGDRPAASWWSTLRSTSRCPAWEATHVSPAVPAQPRADSSALDSAGAVPTTCCQAPALPCFVASAASACLLAPAQSKLLPTGTGVQCCASLPPPPPQMPAPAASSTCPAQTGRWAASTHSSRSSTPPPLPERGGKLEMLQIHSFNHLPAAAAQRRCRVAWRSMQAALPCS